MVIFKNNALLGGLQNSSTIFPTMVFCWNWERNNHFEQILMICESQSFLVFRSDPRNLYRLDLYFFSKLFLLHCRMIFTKSKAVFIGSWIKCWNVFTKNDKNLYMSFISVLKWLFPQIFTRHVQHFGSRFFHRVFLPHTLSYKKCHGESILWKNEKEGP